VGEVGHCQGMDIRQRLIRDQRIRLDDELLYVQRRAGILQHVEDEISGFDLDLA
jgi:hypothetical protein